MVTDSGSCIDQSDGCQDSSRKSLEMLDGVSAAGADQSKVESQALPNRAASLGPVTPDASKENGDFPFDYTSPLTAVIKPLKVLSFDSQVSRNEAPFESVDDGRSSPQTPKDGVFDPFAPGPHDMVLAPLCKKYLDEARFSVARQLNFDSSFKIVKDANCGDDLDSISDDEMFESVYENLLEAIVSKQTEGFLAEISSNFEWDSDGCKTPPSVAVRDLDGVADSCPAAPMKPSGKSRKIDLGLCRKLEF